VVSVVLNRISLPLPSSRLEDEISKKKKIIAVRLQRVIVATMVVSIQIHISVSYDFTILP
jgi:hypothetical protein